MTYELSKIAAATWLGLWALGAAAFAIRAKLLKQFWWGVCVSLGIVALGISFGKAASVLLR